MAILPIPRWTIYQNGRVVPLAKLITTLSGTSTAASVYTTAALDVAHANPVIANSGGTFPLIFLDPAVTYRFVVTDADNATVFAAMDGMGGPGAVQTYGAVGTGTEAGTNTGYDGVNDPIVSYVIPTALVLAAGVTSPLDNPAGPSSYFTTLFGNLLVLPTGRAVNSFDDLDGLLPGLFINDTWTDASSTNSSYYNNEGSPKSYMRNGLILRVANDASEISFDRAQVDGTGAIINYTADDTIGHIYARPYTYWPPDQTTYRRFGARVADIGLKYVHPTGVNYPGGRIDFTVARSDNAASVLEPILRMEAPTLNGIATGLQIRSVPGAGAWREVNQQTLITPLMFSTGASTVAGGNTRYFGVAAVSATETDVGQRMLAAGSLISIYARASTAPTAGQTFIYTVAKNGVDTAITVTIADTATAQENTALTFTYVAGDRIAVKVVASATAATAIHMVTVGVSHGVHLTRSA